MPAAVSIQVTPQDDQQKRIALFKQAVLDINAYFRARGIEVIVEECTEDEEDAEYRVVFPPNRNAEIEVQS